MATSIILYQYKGTVIRVIDGDTIICSVSLGFDVYKQVTIRLSGINTPELKGEESALAKRAKNYLNRRILNKVIYFNSKRYDKYKRSIAEIFLSPTDAKSVNVEMIEKGYGKKVSY